MAGKYVVVDTWTTQDGEWFVSDKPYSIDQEHLDKWGNEPIDGKGCAVCIFTKLQGGEDHQVRYFTTAGLTFVKDVDPQRWAHSEMANPGSGYNPSNNVGPWSTMAHNAPSDLLDGIGLPAGNHVTTFVVLEWREEDEGPTPPDPEPGPGPEFITVMVKVGETNYGGRITKVGP